MSIRSQHIKSYTKAIKLIIEQYIYSINSAIDANPQDYRLQIERSLRYYELHKIQPDIYQLQPAILSYRKAFKFKNDLDPFYKLSVEKKEQLYRKILSQFETKQMENILDLKAINDLLVAFKNDILAIEQIQEEINEYQTKLIEQNAQIEIIKRFKKLLDINKKYQKIEIYDFILQQINLAVSYIVFFVPDLFYVKGRCLLYKELAKDRQINFQYIFDIFNEGFNIKTPSEKETKKKLSEYSNSVILLLTTNQRETIKAKNKIAEKAINNIVSLEYCDDNNQNESKKIDKHTLEESKFLNVGNIYSCIEEYHLAVKSYLYANQFYKKQHFISHEYANKIAYCFRYLKNKERKKILLDSLSFEEPDRFNFFYSYISFKVGQRFLYDRTEDLSKEALESFDEALKGYYGQYQVEILFARAKALKRLGKFRDAIKSIIHLLEIDKNIFSQSRHRGYLYEDNYRQALKFFLEIEFNQKRYEQQSRFLDIKLSQFKTLVSNLDRWKSTDVKLMSDDFAEKKIIRMASIHYVKGLFIYEKRDFQFFDDSDNLFNNEKRLILSFYEFRKAYQYIDDNISIDEIRKKSSPEKSRTKLFLLQIIENILTVGYLLKEYNKIARYLVEGNKLINILLEDKKDKKVANNIKNIDLIKAFRLIDTFRISLLPNPIDSIEQAEIRKATCLINTFSELKQSNKFSFDNLKRILKPNMAIIYWHFSLVEINCYVLINKNQPEVIDHQLVNYENFIKFKQICLDWHSCINGISEDPSLWQIRSETKSINKHLKKLGKILKINSIIDKLTEEPNIQSLILIPHRDLHGLPLHILFQNFLGNIKSKEYSSSFLPSIKIGLEIDPTPPPGSGMLVIHPSNESGEYLYHARAEATAISLKTENAFSRGTTTLEGDPNTSWDKLNTRLRTSIDFSYLHFLGHGRHDFEDPKNSNLELTGTKDLTLEHIQSNFDLSNYYLVCLSACETGITSPLSPVDEYVGLVSTLLAQGVSYVVTTLWKVEDMSASLLMIKFYDELIKEKRHPVDALSNAQYWLRTVSKIELVEWCKCQYKELDKNINNIPEINFGKSKGRIRNRLRPLINEAGSLSKSSSSDLPYKNPYYWAGFTITGLIK